MIINTEYRQTHKPSYQQLDFRKLLHTGFHISFHEHWAHILDQSESFSLRFCFDFAWDQCNPGNCFIRNCPTHIVFLLGTISSSLHFHFSFFFHLRIVEIFQISETYVGGKMCLFTCICVHSCALKTFYCDLFCWWSLSIVMRYIKLKSPSPIFNIKDTGPLYRVHVPCALCQDIATSRLNSHLVWNGFS